MKIQVTPNYVFLALCLSQAVAAAPITQEQRAEEQGEQPLSPRPINTAKRGGEVWISVKEGKRDDEAAVPIIGHKREDETVSPDANNKREGSSLNAANAVEDVVLARSDENRDQRFIDLGSRHSDETEVFNDRSDTLDSREEGELDAFGFQSEQHPPVPRALLEEPEAGDTTSYDQRGLEGDSTVLSTRGGANLRYSQGYNIGELSATGVSRS